MKTEYSQARESHVTMDYKSSLFQTDKQAEREVNETKDSEKSDLYGMAKFHQATLNER